MLRDQETYYSPLLFFLDCLMTLVSYAVSVVVYLDFIARIPQSAQLLRFMASPGIHWDRMLHLLPLVTIPFMFFLQFWTRDASYEKHRVRGSLFGMALPSLFVLIVFLCMIIVHPGLIVYTWFVVIFAAVLWLLLMADRALIRRVIGMSSRRKKALRYLLVVGTDASSLSLARSLTAHRAWGIKIVGLLTANEAEVGTQIGGFNVLGKTDDLFLVLEKFVVDCVVLAEETNNQQDVQSIALRCPVVGVDFILNVSAFVKKVSYVGFESMRDHSFIVFKPVWLRPELLFVKRLIDLCVSGIVIVLCMPFWIVVPILIKKDSPGPVFYVQERVGKNGRLFSMFKFRSMVQGADKMQEQVMHLNEMDGPVFKIRNDPRLTRIGRFLRRTSLDELPQLFNVFNGTMSLVGPRPPIVKEVSQYRPWQRKRLSVTPGVTCLWQVTGRNEVKFDEWMKLDMQYIDNWSLALDVKILLRTIKAVTERRGAL
jgi:exopolysaccharide biosynthesis polyprenyl glycosylphosphotransferase